jgi:hypothetical protein
MTVSNGYEAKAAVIVMKKLKAKYLRTLIYMGFVNI